MTRTLIALVLLCFAAPLAAQEGDAAAPPTDPIIAEAVQKLEAGDDAGALQILETLRGSENPPVQGLALLGALYTHSGRPLDALDILEPLAEAPNPDPAVLFNAGRAAASLGQMQRAAGYYQRSVQLQPSSPARRELGILLGGVGQYSQALALLKPWAKENPTDVEARLAAAFSAVQLERVPDAEELLGDLPQTQPQVSLLWGKILLIKGDPWGALNLLQPALETAPAQMQLDLRRTLSEAYTSVGQAAEAVDVLAPYSQNDPSIALQVSQAQYQSGDLEGALETVRPFAESLIDDPNPDMQPTLAARLVFHHGRFLAMRGEHEAALPYLERASEMDPGEKQTWQMLGQTLAGLGRRDEAQIALERFQEISKADISASKLEMQEREEREDPTLTALRETYALLGEERFSEALERIRQERALSPNDLRPVLLEGRVLGFLGRHQEAFELADQVVQAVPDSADGVYLRGTANMGLGRTDAAEADFRQALALQPEHTATMNDLAVLLIEDGQTAEARALLERVLERNPADKVAAENLAGIEG